MRERLIVRHFDRKGRMIERHYVRPVTIGLGFWLGLFAVLFVLLAIAEG